MIKNDTTSEIFTCSHSESQKWAQGILDNHHDYQGIIYPCRHNNQYKAIALFEGRTPPEIIAPIGSLDTLPEVFDCLIAHGVGII